MTGQRADEDGVCFLAVDGCGGEQIEGSFDQLDDVGVVERIGDSFVVGVGGVAEVEAVCWGEEFGVAR
ncbi:hypothetical protein [Nocardia fluminea]|uniref:hypothetical protein n=1 Tax=Nocardia fluminea TaxID=134984 RepID=UPI003D10E5C2